MKRGRQEYASLGIQARNASVLGRYSAAQELRKRAAELARQQNLAVLAASYVAPDVMNDALIGKCETDRLKTEFRKIVDHKGSNWGVIHSVSVLALGRAAALARDNAEAKKAYENFLAIWKDADSDLPVLIQARKEFAAIP